MKLIKIALVFFVVLLLCLFLTNYIPKKKVNKKPQNNESITVIFTGFGSKDLLGRWRGETAPFLKKLEDTKEVSKDIPMCNSGFEGHLSGQKVLVVASGMAKVKTTACMTDVLNNYKERVKEVILAGIAGFTPMKGGLQDESGSLRDGEKVMIGDVCINSAAFDFDLQHYTADQSNTSRLEPVFWAQRSEFASAYVEGDKILAEELYSASNEVQWPEPSSDTVEINNLYHKESRNPKAWNLTECLESTDDLFWHDIRADKQARNIGARFLNELYDTSLTPDDILIATSMEATSVGSVVAWWNNSNGTDISFAYVRGASNFDHVWLNADGTPGVGGKESIESLLESGGAEFAIETAALPVLKMFELRSNK